MVRATHRSPSSAVCGPPVATTMSLLIAAIYTSTLLASRTHIRVSPSSRQGGLKSDMISILNGEADAGKELFELPVMIKADVQGSEQALSTALRCLRYVLVVYTPTI